MIRSSNPLLLLFCVLVAFNMMAVVMCEEDYYKILGIARNADDAAIKKAFKKMSLKYHPDKNKENPEAAEKQFVKVANAYETLLDPEKRKIYDQYGEEGVKKNMGQQQGGGGNFGNFQDIFNHFWGGQQGGGGGGFGGGGGQFHFNFGGGGGGGHQHHQQHHHQQQQQQEEPENFWENSDVQELSMNEISKYYRRNEVWILYFYKIKDKESKQHKDMIRELAEKLWGIVKVAAINCAADREEALCEDFTMYDVPKIAIVPANLRAEPITYHGPMEFGRISSAAFAQMESFVLLVNDENYESFLKENFDKTIVLSFTQKKVTPALLKVLSKEYKGKLVFGEVRDTNKKLIEKWKITQYPTILVVTDGDIYEGIRYQGEMKKDSIKDFLREFAYTPTKLKRKTGSSGVLQGLNPNLVQQGSCGSNDNNICFLAIINKDSEHKKLLNTLSNLASQYKEDPINFYYVYSQNINYSNTFENVGDFPRVFLLRSKRNKYYEYTGALEEKPLKSYVEMVLSGSGDNQKMKGPVSVTHHAYNEEL
jgi:DnaJ family protein C protein 16